MTTAKIKSASSETERPQHRSTSRSAKPGSKSSRAITRSKAKTASRRGATKPAGRKKKPSSAQKCWPGFEPTRGKAAGEKGSCKPKPGRQPKSVRLADQKRAAANKLRKTNPR
jgi:hypothetical protein